MTKNLKASFFTDSQSDQMAYIFCEDFVLNDKENALVQKDSTVKKNPIKVEVDHLSIYFFKNEFCARILSLSLLPLFAF